jgi:acetyl-CoA carboxylase biotin carboxyl carrier protein
VAEESDTPRPFDVRTIRFLVRLMGRHDLSEIDLQEGDQRIRLRRGMRPSKSWAPVVGPPAVSDPAPGAKPAAEKAPPKPAKKLVEIKCQVVGTFYAQKEPSLPPYVSVGSRVAPETIIGQIEAMKVFTEIPADCSGVIEEVVVKNKDFVEYGTVLFRVDPTG